MSHSKPLTYGDYLGWKDDKRWELIDGTAYLKVPTPNWRHQELAGEIFRQVANQLAGTQLRLRQSVSADRLNPTAQDQRFIRYAVRKKSLEVQVKRSCRGRDHDADSSRSDVQFDPAMASS